MTHWPSVAGMVSSSISAPHADLVVEAVSAPTAAQSGDSVKVSWRVRNSGDSTTDSSQWKDYVYLSSDNQLDASDILLAQGKKEDARAAYKAAVAALEKATKAEAVTLREIAQAKLDAVGGAQ